MSGRAEGSNYFRFLFAYADRILRHVPSLVNPSQNTSRRGLEPAFSKARAIFRKFVIIRKLPPEWRYRLGVRTEDSQSSNPGSIPGSATKSHLIFLNFQSFRPQ